MLNVFVDDGRGKGKAIRRSTSSTTWRRLRPFSGQSTRTLYRMIMCLVCEECKLN